MPARPAIGDEVRSLSVRELVDEAEALARHFAASGRKPGEVVSIMLPNWHEAAIIYLAATFAGLAVNLILPNYREREVAYMLADCNSRLIFIPRRFRDFDYVDMMRAVNAELPDPVEVVVLRGAPAEFAAYEGLPRPLEGHLPKVDPGSVKLVMYTSGTSGRPKGVLHSHRSIQAAVEQVREYWQVAPGDRWFVPSPISHIGGSIYAFELPFIAETSAILQESWNPEAAVARIDAEAVTHMAGATPFLRGLLTAARAAGSALPSLKVFICGGASVPPSLIRAANAAFGNAIVSRVYGCTEIPMITVGAMAKGEIDNAAETDGAPGYCEVKLAAAPTGWELCARGPQMLLGYIAPEDNRDAFDEDGYFRTGDLGFRTPSGMLVITGRKKDLIIRNGENIAPKEIEDILGLHPDIAEIAIVGLPDPRTGEQACAVIVPAAGHAPGVADLARFLAARGVAKFKYPERVVLADSLPRNAAGKVLKNELRGRLAEPAAA